MPAPVTVATFRERARKLVERDQRAWAADPEARPRLELVLHPPIERAALADQPGAYGWVRSWRQAMESDPCLEVAWGERAWPSIGAQSVPERAVLVGADAIAGFAGTTTERDWRTLRDRAALIRSNLGHLAQPEALATAIRANGRILQRLPEPDVATLLHVVGWLVRHPASGRRVRELPIRGIDTKWLERHRGVVESLHTAATAHDSLGLRTTPVLVRMRFLDPALRPGGLTDISAPVEELAALPIRPRVIFVFENLETVLAMPEVEGAVAVHGAGYAVGRLAGIPWVRDGRVVYWGDLDSDGFAILHVLRSGCTDVSSVLMGEEVLLAHRDLWVPESRPAKGSYVLTDAEQVTLDRIRAEGNVRLEQERIDWSLALEALLARV